MPSTTKTPEHIVPAFDLPRRCAHRGEVAEVAAAAEVAAEAPQAPAALALEGRMVCSEIRWRLRKPKKSGICN